MVIKFYTRNRLFIEILNWKILCYILVNPRLEISDSEKLLREMLMHKSSILLNVLLFMPVPNFYSRPNTPVNAISILWEYCCLRWLPDSSHSVRKLNKILWRNKNQLTKKYHSHMTLKLMMSWWILSLSVCVMMSKIDSAVPSSWHTLYSKPSYSTHLLRIWRKRTNKLNSDNQL